MRILSPAILVLALALIPFPLTAEKSLDGDRFVYLGAFRLPSSIYSADFTLYPNGDPGGGGDGFPGSLFVFSGFSGTGPAYQVSVPAPQISANQNNLPEASILSYSPSIVCNKHPDQGNSGGIAYLPAQDAVAEKLYWNIFEYYNVVGTDHDPGGWIDLDFSGCAGTWHYGPRDRDTYHSMKTEDFLFRIWDTDWADSVLGGRYLISGKTREAGVFGSGRGINLYAVAPYLSGNPPANGSTVSAQVLMHYPQPPDPGEMPGIGGDPPYRACDRFSGGAWVRVGNEDAVVIVGRKSLGPERYGQGNGGDCNNYQGYHCDPYEPRFWFLDPSDFEPVIAGTDDPWDVVPYAIYDPSNETYDDDCSFDHEVSGGAAFDYANSLFYFVEPEGISSRIIHVYRVTGSSENYTLTVSKTGAGFGTVSSSPAGINCGVDCQEVYSQGTNVSLDAIANNGSYFAGWSGDADCGDGTVTMSFDRHCTATFELGAPPTHTLSLTKTGTGSGTVTSSPAGINCGGDCQEDYDQGTIVQLTATPDAGSVFAGWSGAADCSDGTVTMDADTSCAATFNEAPGALGLVAAYGLDEGSGNTAADASGQGNGGTLNGATWTSQGYFGNALSFDGVNDMVTVPDADSLDLTTGMTLEAWVRPTALSGWRTALLKESGSGLAYTLYAHDNAPRPATYVLIGGEESANGSATLPLHTWSHLAATYDGSTLRFYLNGQQVGSRNASGAIQTTNFPLCIGGNTVWGEYFEGRIDEIRVYDRALTQSEIQQDMNTPIGDPGDTSFSLNVTRSGSGSGTVTSSPPGIDCGADCSEVYQLGTVVQLDAVPDNGSEFIGWSGSSDCSDGQVTMNSQKTCTANFDLLPPEQTTLSVSKSGSGSGTVVSSPAGIDCGSDCSEVFDYGRVVGLATSPDAGSQFDGWSGDPDCADGTITMNTDLTCIANFSLIGGTEPSFCPAYEDSPLFRQRTRQVQANPSNWISRIEGAQSGDEILLADGTYSLDQYAVGITTEITIRSASGNCNAVLIQGQGYGTESEGFMVMAPNVTLADLSMTGIRNHAISIKGNLGGQATHMYNVHLYDIGTQHVKGSGSPDVQDGVLACSRIGYSPGGVQGDYINGLDIHGAIDWIIRDNEFYNIWGDGSGCEVDINCGTYLPGGGPSILLWNGASGNIVERNRILDSFRGIALGFSGNHAGGTVRNNFFFQSNAQQNGVPGDAGISIWGSNTTIDHNTVILGGSYPGAIEFLNSTNLQIRNNLLKTPVWNRGGSTYNSQGNKNDATPADLVAPGDPHLDPDSNAVDFPTSVDLPSVDSDIDGDTRPNGPKHDAGCDEYTEGGDPPPQHTLNVTKAGDGTGAVASNPAGINCGNDCTESYDEGTVVQLGVLPDEGSEFAGWSGSNDCNDGQVTMNNTRNCIATFDLLPPEQHVLNVTKAGDGTGAVTSNPAGINCGNDCSESYDEGTGVTLTATPSPDSEFAGWSGSNDCNDGQLTMNNTRNCIATFDLLPPQQHTLNVTKAGDGTGAVTSNPAGINCGNDCSESYDEGTGVTLTATPSPDSEFAGWSGSNDCNDGQLTMNNTRNCIATFDLLPPEQFALTVSKAGDGTGAVTSNPAGINCGNDCSESYDEGTGVTLTATPSPDSEFAGWSGSNDCNDGQLTMNNTRNCIATFDLLPPEQFALTVSKAGDGTGAVASNPAGINCGSDCTESYDEGTVVQLGVLPDEGSEFAGWSGSNDCTDGQVTMNNTRNCIATFDLLPPEQHTLNVTKAGDGSGAVASNPAGINCGNDCTESYDEGTVVQLGVLPDEGSEFAGWSGSNDCNDGQVTMNNTRNCIATFDLLPPQQHTLNVAKAGDGTGTVTSNPAGINCGNDCTESYDEGTVVQLGVLPDEGSEFVGWSGSNDCTDGQVTMNNTRNCVATFNLLPPEQHTLNVTKAGNGTGAVASNPAGINCGNDCTESYDEGTVVQLGVLPDEGSEFVGWSGSADCSDGQVTMNNTRNCIATFDLLPPEFRTLTVEKSGNGSGAVISNPEGIWCGGVCEDNFPLGTTVVLAASPQDGSVFVGWIDSAGCVDGVAQMDDHRSCEAVFRLEQIFGSGFETGDMSDWE